MALAVFMLAGLVNIGLPGGRAEAAGDPVRIPLTTAMVTNETGYGDALRLVNEQELAGDPKNGTGGAPSSFWFGNLEEAYPPSAAYPAAAVIDLGEVYSLSDIYLYDYNDPTGTWDNPDANPSTFSVYTGTSGNWELQYAAVRGATDTWLHQSVDQVQTRYVRVTMNRLSAIMSEIVLYGTRVSPPKPPKIPLNLSMVTGHDNAPLLLNSYQAADPINGVKGPDNVFPSTDQDRWRDWDGDAYIDLGQPYHIEDIFIADGEGSVYNYPTNSLKVYAGSGDPIVWTELFNDGLKSYMAWKEFPVDVTTRYIRVRKDGGGDINGIMLYGKPIPTPILLADTMLTDVSGFNNASQLVDHQALAGDPLAGTSSIATVSFVTGMTDNVSNEVGVTSHPASAVIDLGAPYEITNIALLDGNGIAPVGEGISFYAGEPDNWGTALFTDRMLNRGIWNTHPVTVTTRYLKIVKSHTQANLAEILVYGTRVGGAIADETPPADITNLSATAVSSGSVSLRWTAPGSNGTAGRAASYEVRYSTEPIDDSSWAAAQLASGIPTPQPAGQQENMTVSGLSSDTTYYFAVKTKDAVGNESGLSNVLSEKTLIIDVIAPGLIEDLDVTYVSGNAIKLTWTATGNDGEEGTAASYDIRTSQSPITADNWDAATEVENTPIPTASGTRQTYWVNHLDASTLYYIGIRAQDEAGNLSDYAEGLAVTATTTALAASSLLALSPDMVINESANGDATKLVDQQEGIDPRASINGTFNVDDASQRWVLGNAELYQPASAVIDFGTEVEISDVYLYDGNDGGGSVKVTLSVGDPFNWQDVATDTLANWKQWNRHQMKVTSRYLRILRADNSSVLEVAVYGTLLGTPEAKPEPTAHQGSKMNELIGINAFIDDPLDKMQVAGFVREYHNWNWDEGDLWNFGQIQTGYPGYPNNENKFNPSYAGGGWDFDDYYSKLKNAGITAVPAIQGSVSWISTNQNNKPLSSGEDALLPASYAEHADHMFQFAARYGSTQVADDKLKLAAGQPRSTGLGTLSYYENWNEQDKWWEKREAYFSPYEYAAMTSADYDGHELTLGTTLGIKNADPNAKLVMGGLADPNLDYIKAVKFWADFNRTDGSLPIDVLNIHHYSNSGGMQGSGNVGISPEADGLKEKLEKFVEYRDRYLPGKEVWITEFGYDTHPSSIQRAPTIGATSQEEVQGQWIVRSYLAAAAAGIDRAAMYMLRDSNPNSSVQFSTSGLVSSPGTGHTPKSSWYYVYTLKNQLTDMRYKNEVSSGNDNVKIYKFANDDGDQSVYVVWAPTSDNIEVDGYQLTLDEIGSSAKLVTMEHGSTTGIESDLTVVDGKVTVDVSERPIFVKVSATATGPEPNHAPVISSPANGSTIAKTEGDHVSLTVAATDADNDTLTYSVAGLPNGATYTMNAGTGVFSWTTPSVGTHTLTFTVSDGNEGGTASVTVTVTVTAAQTQNNNSGTVTSQEPAPVITQGTITLQPKQNERGEASLNLTADAVKQAAAGALGELKISVGSDSSGKQPSSVSVALPAKSLDSAASSALDLTIDTGLAVVTIPAATLADVIGDSDKSLTLTVARVDTNQLSSEARAQVGDHPVFDLTLMLGEETISRFGSKEGELIEIRIPYHPTASEQEHGIIVYYIADDGTITVVNNGRYDAATGTVTFRTNHFSHYAVGYVSVSFKDLAGSRWAQPAIEALAARGIVKGFGEGQFRPQGKVTRAEFLSMLVAALGLAPQTGTASSAAFSDVASGAWYADVVRIASSLGIAKGRGDGKFGPNDNITRAEMSILLARALKLAAPGGAAPFADTAALSTEANAAIANAAAAGLLEGFADGSFKPRDTATRAQAATVMYRLLNR